MTCHKRRAITKNAKSESVTPDRAEPRAAVIAAMRAGNMLSAQALCRQALEERPEDPERLILMALVCFNAGQFDHAVEWAARAIRRDPRPDYLTTLGTALLNAGRCEDAVNVFDKAVQLKPNHAELWSNLGDALVALGRASEAILCFNRTFELEPQRANAAFKAGGILREVGQLDEALAFFDACKKLQPDHSPTLQLRALTLDGLGRHEEALHDNLRADALEPANPSVWVCIGYDLMQLGRHAEALPWFDRALEVQPDFVRAIHNKALSLFQLNRFNEARVVFERLMELDGHNPEAIWDFALLQMLMGDFEAGWVGREARFNLPSVKVRYPRFDQPRWSGDEPLEGRTVLLYADEGIGDSIQFARYAPMVAGPGARVVLVVEKAVRPLLAGLSGVAECLSKSDPLPAFDLHCPISSLPLAFRTRLDTIPAAQSYLPAPPPGRIRAWQDRLGPHDRLRVGLVWSGNPNHSNDRHRSMPLNLLMPLLDVDATFVSVQKDPREDDRITLASSGILDLTEHLTDFVETAALLSCLDLVITVDTSVAHLAGGLGRPTWILLPFTPDFRWLIGRDDSPWYPSVRLFRQTETRDYADVILRVRAELLAAVEIGAARHREPNKAVPPSERVEVICPTVRAPTF
jgi:tetratricopeptide (TPR) repeat protein